MGATRWKGDEEPPSEREAFEHLLGTYHQAVKVLAGEAVLWEGERMVTEGQRLPYAGPLPGQKNAFVLGGLGSKGMLYGPIAAKDLADQILRGAEGTDSFVPRFR